MIGGFGSSMGSTSPSGSSGSGDKGATEVRWERRQKLKRVFNYDAEMKFLESFWNIKKKEMGIDDFKVLATKMLVDTDQVSDVILEMFVEDEKTREQIKDKQEYNRILEERIQDFEQKIDVIEDAQRQNHRDIDDLEKELSDENPNPKQATRGATDPCGRTVTRSSC